MNPLGFNESLSVIVPNRDLILILSCVIVVAVIVIVVGLVVVVAPRARIRSAGESVGLFEMLMQNRACYGDLLLSGSGDMTSNPAVVLFRRLNCVVDSPSGKIVIISVSVS